ncbi:unnamed protein product, partial [Amoebophrya sp. A25]|eukprot:GSA25T00003415001.1
MRDFALSTSSTGGGRPTSRLQLHRDNRRSPTSTEKRSSSRTRAGLRPESTEALFRNTNRKENARAVILPMNKPTRVHLFNQHQGANTTSGGSKSSNVIPPGMGDPLPGRSKAAGPSSRPPFRPG